jgi:hypothetical protein
MAWPVVAAGGDQHAGAATGWLPAPEQVRVFEIVQDNQPPQRAIPGRAHPGDAFVERERREIRQIESARTSAGGHLAGDQVGLLHVQPEDPSGKGSLALMGKGGGQHRLADAGHTDDGHRRIARQQIRQLSQNLVTADQGHRLVGHLEGRR